MKAVFLDRDGTVIEHVHHLRRVEDVRLVPGAASAIRRLREAGYLAVLATNQSVVGRGLLDEAGLDRIHEEMSRRLRAEGALLDAIYWNPHAPPERPGTPEHPDRKPGPGMLLRAAAEHRLELSSSWMVGDSTSDLLAGRAAGCRGSILVRTGLGREASSEHAAAVVADLAAAVDWILARGSEAPARR